MVGEERLNPIWLCPYQKEKVGHIERHTHRECCVNMKSEIGLNWNQGIPEVASKQQGVGERDGINSTSQQSEGTNSSNTDHRFLAFKTVRQYNSIA